MLYRAIFPIKQVTANRRVVNNADPGTTTSGADDPVADPVALPDFEAVPALATLETIVAVMLELAAAALASAVKAIANCILPNALVQ